MMAHSKIGASSMYRWSQCPGSVRLSEGIESKSSKYAEEGTQAHAMAEEILRGGTVAGLTGEQLEMRENVNTYVNYVRSLCSGDFDVLWVEHKFDLSSVYPGLFGTADAVAWEPFGKHLHVIDLKYGAGKPVEVKDNPQLRYYALGALWTLKLPAKEITITVVQPRCPHPDGPIRSETINAVDLIDWAADLVAYAKATEDPNAPLKAGDHCHWCPAAGICPKLREDALAVAQREFRPDTSYDPALLADTLSKLGILEAFIKGVREFAYGEAEHGRCPPGWKLVEKRATRKWRDPDEAAATIDGLGLGIECYEAPKVKSVAQLEKALPKEHRGILKDLATQESSGFTLAPEDDRREAVRKDAAAEFSPVLKD